MHGYLYITLPISPGFPHFVLVPFVFLVRPGLKISRECKNKFYINGEILNLEFLPILKRKYFVIL